MRSVVLRISTLVSCNNLGIGDFFSPRVQDSRQTLSAFRFWPRNAVRYRIVVPRYLYSVRVLWIVCVIFDMCVQWHFMSPFQTSSSAYVHQHALADHTTQRILRRYLLLDLQRLADQRVSRTNLAF